MLACKYLFRNNFLAWKPTNTCPKSKSTHNLQGFQVDMDQIKREVVNQTSRAVSTQSTSCPEGDVKMGKLQSQTEYTHVATYSSVVRAKWKTMNSEDVNKLGNAVKHSKSMEIGQSLMRFIIGKGGGTRKEIEAETGVNIIFPSSRKEDSIIIEGSSVESVANASEKIQMIINKAVNSRALDYSHFVSLPLAIHPELVDKLIQFQNTILEIACDDEKNHDRNNTGDAHADELIISDQHPTKAPIVAVELKDEDADVPAKVNITNIPLVSYAPGKSRISSSDSSSSKLRELGIEKSIFIKPKTFHLTILMLKLWNNERVDAAAEVLQSVSSKVMDALDNQPVSIKLKGLECMKGSAAKAHILYVPVEEIGGENRLLLAIQVIVDAFIEAGLVIEPDLQHKLKLHATIMNARHSNRNNNNRKWSEPFDASSIFDRYGSADWGEYPLLEAHLSERFRYDANGYYHCCASIPFPGNLQLK